jgi:dolichyl-phosphate-mannose-protein mannosyltransferase
VLHFLLSETIEYPISVAGHYTRPRPRQWAELGTRGPIIVVGFFIALFAAFVYLAPLTYGTPGYVLHIYVNRTRTSDALELQIGW